MAHLSVLVDAFQTLRPLRYRRVVVLAVGEVFAWHKATSALPPHSKVTFFDFCDVNALLLKNIRPDIVLSCLVCRDYDFLDLAAKLATAHFRGKFRIIVPNIPKPQIIRSEASELYPELDIEIAVDLSQPARLIN